MEHAHMQCMYTQCMHVAASMRFATPTNGSPMRAPPHTRARAACARARARVRVRSGAHASAPTHASAFGRRGPRVARRAGVPVGVGVQREHRRVECTTCDHLQFCVRKRRPGGLHQARRVRQLGVDAANGVPDLELAVSSLRDAGSEHNAIDGHAEVRMPAGACDIFATAGR